MPQIQQFQTSNVLANWQGFPSNNSGGHGSPNSLTVRASYGCTLTFISSGQYRLRIPIDLTDENTQIEVEPQDGHIYSIRIVWNADGSADLFFTSGGDVIDPGVFNIVVFGCTDFVSSIEGPPGNP
jgi:hypothetical protein